LAHIEAAVRDAGQADAMLVFLSTDCLTCRAVADGLSPIQAGLDAALVAIVDARRPEERLQFLRSVDLQGCDVLQDEGELADKLGVRARPTVLAIRDGVIVKGATVTTPTQVEKLARDLASTRARAHRKELVTA